MDRLGGRLLNVSDGLRRPRSRGQVVIGETPTPPPRPTPVDVCRVALIGITRLAGFGVLTLVGSRDGADKGKVELNRE
jgi:hypothetical protein